MKNMFIRTIVKQTDVCENVEERINRLFKRLDEYMHQRAFEVLTLKEVTSLVSNFAQTRRSRMELGMSRDENLYELEKDFRWLMGIMRERNLQKITR